MATKEELQKIFKKCLHYQVCRIKYTHGCSEYCRFRLTLEDYKERVKNEKE